MFATWVASQLGGVAGSAAHVRDVDLPAAMELPASRSEGWADVAPTVLPLDEVIEHGFVALAERKAKAVKIPDRPPGRGGPPLPALAGGAGARSQGRG